MDRPGLLAFLRAHRLCVQATVSPYGFPQAAVVGFAVTDELELVFDTEATSRKVKNLREDPRMAVVVGGDEDKTAQLEGIADEPTGAERARLVEAYLRVWPDGVERAAWPHITYVRFRPHWARYSDFGPGGGIVTWDEDDLVGEGSG